MSEIPWDDLMVSLGLPPSRRRATSKEARAANTARCRAARHRRRSSALPPGDPRHGKASTYTNWACRCDRCRVANTQACVPRMQLSRARRVSA